MLSFKQFISERITIKPAEGEEITFTQSPPEAVKKSISRYKSIPVRKKKKVKKKPLPK